MFNRFFKPAITLTRTTRTLTTYPFNKFRNHYGPDLLWGGLFGGMIIGGSLGFSAGLTSSASDYMQAKKKNSLSNLSSIPERTAEDTVGGVVCGAFTGVGLTLALLAPEAALVGVAVALAYKDEKSEDEKLLPFRR